MDYTPYIAFQCVPRAEARLLRSVASLEAPAELNGLSKSEANPTFRQ